MTTKTIEYVHPEIREWESADGKKMWFVTVNFDDESQGSDIAFAKAQAEEIKQIFTDLKGVPTDFTLEANGEYQGIPKFKIKGYPGKPSGGGGGGGGGRGGGGMTHAQAGLLAAASVVGGWLAGGKTPALALVEIDGDVDLVLGLVQEMGEKLTEHLYSRRKDAGAGEQPDASREGAPPVSPAPAPAAPANSLTLAQIKTIKELAKIRGIEAELLASTIGVNVLGDLSEEDAATLIESWTA